MDFIDWSSVVLERMLQARQASHHVRTYGQKLNELSAMLFGEGAVNSLAFLDASYASARARALLAALYGLRDVGLVEQFGMQGAQWRVSELGRALPPDLTPVWEPICMTQIDADCEEFLRVVNRLSPREEAGFTWLESVDGGRVRTELGWPSELDHLLAVVEDLERLGLASPNVFFGGNFQVQATYQGLVWETRRGLTVESQCIDQLVAEWETTSVDFKRELGTDTKDQKAEFIKDIGSAPGNRGQAAWATSCNQRGRRPRRVSGGGGTW